MVSEEVLPFKESNSLPSLAKREEPGRLGMPYTLTESYEIQREVGVKSKATNWESEMIETNLSRG